MNFSASQYVSGIIMKFVYSHIFYIQLKLHHNYLTNVKEFWGRMATVLFQRF